MIATDLGKLIRKMPRATLHHKWVDGISEYTARISLSGKDKTSANTVLIFSADTPEQACKDLYKELKKRELV